MNHIEKIAAKLADFGLDAMMITSESGERYNHSGNQSGGSSDNWT